MLASGISAIPFLLDENQKILNLNVKEESKKTSET